jgi:hypothetical protein
MTSVARVLTYESDDEEELFGNILLLTPVRPQTVAGGWLGRETAAALLEHEDKTVEAVLKSCAAKRGLSPLAIEGCADPLASPSTLSPGSSAAASACPTNPSSPNSFAMSSASPFATTCPSAAAAFTASPAPPARRLHHSVTGPAPFDRAATPLFLASCLSLPGEAAAPSATRPSFSGAASPWCTLDNLIFEASACTPTFELIVDNPLSHEHEELGAGLSSVAAAAVLLAPIRFIAQHGQAATRAADHVNAAEPVAKAAVGCDMGAVGPPSASCAGAAEDGAAAEAAVAELEGGDLLPCEQHDPAEWAGHADVARVLRRSLKLRDELSQQSFSELSKVRRPPQDPTPHARVPCARLH